MGEQDAMLTRNAVFDALGTSRAVRRFAPDPVPPETIEALIWAATRAPSPENDQPWEFVVVTDEARRREIGRLVAAAAEMHAASLPPSEDPGVLRSQASAKHLVRHFGETPVMIFVCHHVVDYPEAYASAGVGFSAVFMAAADLLVAARSLGLGAAFTFAHMLAGPDLPALIQLPDDVAIMVTIPIGWPLGPVGPVARRPSPEVLHWNAF
ncbi:MAG TPA: nitroreductase family protein [Acidimicrobiales bacterium]